MVRGEGGLLEYARCIIVNTSQLCMRAGVKRAGAGESSRWKHRGQPAGLNRFEQTETSGKQPAGNHGETTDGFNKVEPTGISERHPGRIEYD